MYLNPNFKFNNNLNNLKEFDEDSQSNNFILSDNLKKSNKNNGRRGSADLPQIKGPELIRLINDNKLRVLPEPTKEVVDDINKVNDYKWKLGVILNDKINVLDQKIKEEKSKINKKEKELSGTNAFKNKIKDLKDLLKKEEEQKYSNEYEKNIELNKRKKILEDKIQQIELNKRNMKDTMMKKFKTMMELKEKLKNSINELLMIQQQIHSRKFALEQEEELKREPMEKKDPQKEEILHLSQNIGQYINDNLLIKNNNYYQ